MGTEIPHPVCDDCKALAIDILSGLTSSSDRWQPLQSNHAALSYAKSHLDGSVASLQQSSEDGCRLCCLILDKVYDLDPSQPTTGYYLFVWAAVPEKCQFQVAVDDISVFTRHISPWQPLKALALFAQCTFSPTLPEIVKGSSGNSRGPPLLYLLLQDPGSQAAFQQAQKWLKDCQVGHQECSRPPSILPKRVLDLGRPEEELNVSLYVTRGEVRPYVAL